MPPRIFKVTTHDRVVRSLASGSDIEELLFDACLNLDITQNTSCQLVLEEDGTRIRNYSLLLNLADNYPNAPLLLMVLPEGKQWEPVAKSVPAPATLSNSENRTKVPSDPSTSTSNGEISHFSNSHGVSKNREIFALPIDEIIPKKLKNIPNNPTGYVLELIRKAADYMNDTLKDISLGTAGRVAELIIGKYPAVFAPRSWTADNHMHSDGLKSLQIRIYDRARKIQDPERKKRKERMDSSDEPDQERTSQRFDKNQDTYGCVSYEPSLPDGESMETQSKKKQTLLESLTDEPSKKLQIDEEIRLVALTYASQRVSLNRRDDLESKSSDEEEDEAMTLKTILSFHWPHLTHTKHFLTHASTLIRKDIFLEWEKNVGMKIPVVVEYFRDYVRKYRAMKNIPQIAKNVQSVLAEMKEARGMLKSELSNTLGFIPLIASYFQEEVLFNLVDTDATDADFKNANDSSRPILIVKGMSLYQEKISCCILIEEQIVLQSESVLQGILLLVLSYYVYGYNYPVAKSSSLEFIQRMLLEINPKKGHKRGKKSKQQKAAEDPRVEKLKSNIIKFELNSI